MNKKHYPIGIVLAVVVAWSSLYLNSLIADACRTTAGQAVSGLSAERYHKPSDFFRQRPK